MSCSHIFQICECGFCSGWERKKAEWMGIVGFLLMYLNPMCFHNTYYSYESVNQPLSPTNAELLTLDQSVFFNLQ